MLLTQERLHELAGLLDGFRSISTEGTAGWCPVKRTDATAGTTAFHGRAFLAIDAETGAVSCNRCAHGVK